MENVTDTIEDEVIYGQTDNLVYPGYDLAYNQTNLDFYSAIHVRDRYINNIIIDLSPGIYTYLRPEDIKYSRLSIDIILPYDTNIQEHYYVHFVSLTDSEGNLPGVRFLIEDPDYRTYNAKHIWQKRKYIKINVQQQCKIGDLIFFVKDKKLTANARSEIEIRDWRPAIDYTRFG